MASDTRERVERELRSSPWSTTHDLARALKVSDSTVRHHLLDLLCDGFVDRRQDDTVPGPRGAGAARWRLLAEPVGPVTPTDALLCNACAVQQFGDRARYNRALTKEAEARLMGAFPDRDNDDWDMPVVCQTCGEPVS